MISSKRNLIIFALSIIGFFISSYLVYAYSYEAPIFCGLKSGCETIRLSPYSKFLGVSVPWFGAGGYGLLAFFSFLAIKTNKEIFKKFILLGAVFGFAFTLYLNYLAFFSIKSYCLWCGFSAVIMTIIFVIAIYEFKFILAQRIK